MLPAHLLHPLVAALCPAGPCPYTPAHQLGALRPYPIHTAANTPCCRWCTPPGTDAFTLIAASTIKAGEPIGVYGGRLWSESLFRKEFEETSDMKVSHPRGAH